MAILLPGFPQNWRAPGVYIANVPRGSAAGVGAQPTLIFGQKLESGTATPNVPVQVFSQADVDTLAGAGSMLSAMFSGYILNDPLGPVYICPLADVAGGAQAALDVTLTGESTAVGSLPVYINNRPIPVAVAVGDTAATVATNLATAINAVVNPVLAVTAAAAAGVVTLTARHKGLNVGDIQVAIAKNGPANGEYVPAGLSVAISTATAGAGDPDLSTALANTAGLPATVIVSPYTNATAVQNVAAWLSDTTGRWSPASEVYGVSVNAQRGTLAQVTSYGQSVSGKHCATLGILDSQTPIYVAAAMFGGLLANTTRATPQLPIVGQIVGLDAPSRVNRLTRAQENNLLFNGISTLRVDVGGNAVLSRAVQNYSAEDSRYLNVETDFLVAYADTYIRTDLEATYAQAALVADGTPTAGASGGLITSPSLILAHVWGLYLNLEQAGIVQQSRQFIAGSYVEADLQAGTVSLFLPITTVGQLRVIRILTAFS